MDPFTLTFPFRVEAQRLRRQAQRVAPSAAQRLYLDTARAWEDLAAEAEALLQRTRALPSPSP